MVIKTNSPEEFYAAVVTIDAREDIDKNLLNAITRIEEAASIGARWIALPEMFIYSGEKAGLKSAAAFSKKSVIPQLQKLARELKIVIFAGSLPEQSLIKNKYYNVAHVIDRQGKITCSYRKTHLFQLNSTASQAIDETQFFQKGDDLAVIELDGLRIGVAICFDVRFSPFFYKMAANKGLDVIVLPSAFTAETGKDHWHVMLRARAMEFQCYVLAPNQCGKHSVFRQSYGHSAIVDPWGELLADTGGIEGIAVAKISRQRLQQVRTILPMQANLRSDLY